MPVEEAEFDADGFLRSADAWSPDLASEIAAREGIGPLSADHMQVIEALRAHYMAKRTLPVMRQICAETGLEKHCVSDLLADPRRAWRIAGLPNPGEEAKAYLESAELPEQTD